MTLSGFVAYIKQLWANKPSTSSPLSAERLNHMEEGIKANSDGITKIVTSVTDQVVNDSNKIPSAASLYGVNQKVDKTNSDFTAELNTKFNKSEISAGSLVPGGNITFPYGAPKWYKIGRVMCISGIFSSSAADAEIASLTPALGPYGSMVLHFRAELFSGSSAAADAVKISITKSAQKTGINVVGATAGRHYSLSVAYVTD